MGFCSCADKKKKKTQEEVAATTYAQHLLGYFYELIQLHVTTQLQAPMSGVGKWQPLPPVDMQRRHHHEWSTARTDSSIS